VSWSPSNHETNHAIWIDTPSTENAASRRDLAAGWRPGARMCGVVSVAIVRGEGREGRASGPEGAKA